MCSKDELLQTKLLQEAFNYSDLQLNIGQVLYLLTNVTTTHH